MKELQKSFKELLSLETMARDFYAGMLSQDIKDEEIINKIEFIKNQEVQHIFMAKELMKISARAESRKKRPDFSPKTLAYLKGDIILKRNLIESVTKILDDKVRNLSLLDFLGKKAVKFKKADETRRESAKIVAHRLKTPLTTSNWISEILLENGGKKINKKERVMIETIRKENNTMLSFIDDLLEEGKVEELGRIKKSEVDLIGIFKESFNELSYLMRGQRQKVNFQYFKDKIIIFSDEKALREIIINLLTNAINYGKKGGIISVKIEKAKVNKILFSVSDKGIGIPQEEQKNIFKKFFRASNAKNIYHRGTGLGLYIIQKLTKKLGGKIDFDSKENKGSTFYVELPVGAHI